jgi:hypothetical protein
MAERGALQTNRRKASRGGRSGRRGRTGRTILGGRGRPRPPGDFRFAAVVERSVVYKQAGVEGLREELAAGVHHSRQAGATKSAR